MTEPTDARFRCQECGTTYEKLGPAARRHETLTGHTVKAVVKTLRGTVDGVPVYDYELADG